MRKLDRHIFSWASETIGCVWGSDWLTGGHGQLWNRLSKGLIFILGLWSRPGPGRRTRAPWVVLHFVLRGWGLTAQGGPSGRWCRNCVLSRRETWKGVGWGLCWSFFHPRGKKRRRWWGSWWHVTVPGGDYLVFIRVDFQRYSETVTTEVPHIVSHCLPDA